MKQSPKTPISIVAPVFNEEAVIDVFVKRLFCVLARIKDYRFQVIVVNDGSTDGTNSLLKKLQRKYNLNLLNLEKNQGQQRAIFAGLSEAIGAAIIVLDADLQDPPEYIPGLIHRWQDGADAVMCRRLTRKDNNVKKMTAFFYYRFLSLFDRMTPLDCGDYYLIDQRVAQKIKRQKTNRLYLRGLIPRFAKDIAYLPIKREARIAGKSGYSLIKMLYLAYAGLMLAVKNHER